MSTVGPRATDVRLEQVKKWGQLAGKKARLRHSLRYRGRCRSDILRLSAFENILKFIDLDRTDSKEINKLRIRRQPFRPAASRCK